MTQIVEKEKASSARHAQETASSWLTMEALYPFYVATVILLHLRYVFGPEDQLEKPHNFL